MKYQYQSRQLDYVEFVDCVIVKMFLLIGEITTNYMKWVPIALHMFLTESKSTIEIRIW